MRGGLRLQLLLLLGALLLVGFLPLLFATSTYTRIALEQQGRKAAASLGRAVSAQVSHQRARQSTSELLETLSAQLEDGSIDALAVYDRNGHAIARVGSPELVDLLPLHQAEVTHPEARDLLTDRGPAVMLFRPDRDGGVSTVTRVDPVTTRASSLTRLIALYVLLGALTVVAVAYFGLTRQVVDPILRLRRAAERVAQGARRLEVPPTPIRELCELASSMSLMTEQLREEEEALRKKVDEVERKTAELEAAQTSLVRSERLAMVGQLAAGLAHEIGNPISALMGLTDLLIEDDQSPEERADFLRRMRKEIERIDRVLRDLLAYARARPLATTDEQPGGDVGEGVDDVVSLLVPQRSLAGVELERSVAGGLPQVSLPQPELVQVLLNLVMNASQALQGSGRVQVSAQSQDGGVVIRVEDDGPGVPQELREKIFEPFFSTKDVGTGTGLGLSVSRGLVEAAGGRLDLLAGGPRGAIFELWLPARSTGARSAGAQVTSGAPPAEPSRAPRAS